MYFSFLRIPLLISLFASSAALATDFQMPANVASGASEGAASKTSLVSKGTYNLLVDVQKSVDQNKIDEAFEKLNKLIERVQKNRYETAVVLKTAGYLYVDQKRYDKAVTLLDHALNLGELAQENQQKLRYDLAQLTVSQDKLSLAIHYLLDWLENQSSEQTEESNKLKVSTLTQLGSVYLRQEQFTAAVKYLEEAGDLDAKPSEYRLQLLLSSYVSANEISKASNVLHDLVALFPEKKRYATQLIALYDQLEQPKNALRAMEYAHANNLLDQTDEISALAYRLMQQGYPQKAALVLEQGLQEFILWMTPENLNLIAQAYLDSKEPGKAIPFLEKAILTSTDNNAALVLTQLYMNADRYGDALSVLEIAIERAKGGIDTDLELLSVHLLHKTQQTDKALALSKKLLEREGLSSSQQQSAEQWVNYLSS